MTQMTVWLDCFAFHLSLLREVMRVFVNTHYDIFGYHVLYLAHSLFQMIGDTTKISQIICWVITNERYISWQRYILPNKILCQLFKIYINLNIMSISNILTQFSLQLFWSRRSSIKDTGYISSFNKYYLHAFTNDVYVFFLRCFFRK